ncbi:hypothetical protein [Accumulibacter sp.]|uniref:hypothetical protein n=1 Tax=Accumulibacter sp. TaxID=2053492 RepID=UPI0025F94C13|nr:hypothetical protein [Accumulibacter sp.]MCM8613435.1 hypothetical protein [Accumulibacter sp.]MCM8637132.1 hypothetical protein [Accumulibacter sp.]MCM8640823.1 hypothetical protein [Accumulibacter sp.]
MDAAPLIARLLARRSLPRSDPGVSRLLVDAGLRGEVEARLAACGLRLLDHPYAANVAIGVDRTAESAVFETEKDWQASNVGLSRDVVALLVLLWALIILPKRERQISRDSLESQGQSELFGSSRPVDRDPAAVSGVVAESALLDDYGKLLGGKARVRQFMLPTLGRLGFIERRLGMIHEGPLLDLALDYAELAPRILQGALGDLLRQRSAGAG